MSFSDVANDLIRLAEKRDEALGADISLLGEDTWHVLLKLFVYRNAQDTVSRSTLENVMRFPSNLDRITAILIERGMVVNRATGADGEPVYAITDLATSKIKTILEGAFAIDHSGD